MEVTIKGISIYVLLSICLMEFNYINFYPIPKMRVFSFIYSMLFVFISLYSFYLYFKEEGK